VLGNIVDQYHKMGFVGEERNIAQLSLRCFTRHLPPTYRRNVIAQGDTGSGKTILLRIVLAPFEKDVENYTFSQAELNETASRRQGLRLTKHSFYGYLLDY
jgi:Cdc6-like AAA superfamily ATPase